jgi:hypothetical protein
MRRRAVPVEVLVGDLVLAELAPELELLEAAMRKDDRNQSFEGEETAWLHASADGGLDTLSCLLFS